MLQVLKFLLDTVIQFIKMLFTVSTGDGLNIGLYLCLAFILLPMMLRIIRYIKQDALEELDDRIDSTRTIESTSYTRNISVKMGPNETYGYNHTISRRRRR